MKLVLSFGKVFEISFFKLKDEGVIAADAVGSGRVDKGSVLDRTLCEIFKALTADLDDDDDDDNVERLTFVDAGDDDEREEEGVVVVVVVVVMAGCVTVRLLVDNDSIIANADGLLISDGRIFLGDLDASDGAVTTLGSTGWMFLRDMNESGEAASTLGVILITDFVDFSHRDASESESEATVMFLSLPPTGCSRFVTSVLP